MYSRFLHVSLEEKSYDSISEITSTFWSSFSDFLCFLYGFYAYTWYSDKFTDTRIGLKYESDLSKMF